MKETNQNKNLVRDIYHPEEYYLGYDSDTKKFVKQPLRSKSRHRGVLYAFFCLFALTLGFYGFRYIALRNLLAASTERIYIELTKAQVALVGLDPESAKDSFLATKDELERVLAESSKYGVLQLTSFSGRFFNQFADLPEVFKELIGVSQVAIDISEDVSFLKNHAVSLVLEERGPELIARLKSFNKKLRTLHSYSKTLANRDAQLGGLAQKLPKLTEKLEELTSVNTAIIEFLDSKSERDLLVLLQNSSEMRPGGGFIGSYAHIRLNRGSLTDIDVVDIYDPDGQLDIKIVPPLPLQRVTKTWGARDANWFFDFPSSAVQVMDLLNASKIYQEQGILFDSVIAINDKVLGDIIALIGPIDLPDYNLKLDAENFLAEIQREVEVGRDKARGEPKKILKILAPLIIERLASLPNSDKLAFRDLIARHIQSRNIMAYVNNSTLENYIKKSGLGGDVFVTEHEKNFDYLAVVNANIAGQKTDTLIDQSITLKSVISTSGLISNSLVVERKHNGADRKEWWYKAVNKNYLQIFTPQNSSPLLATGQVKWPTPIKRSYKDHEVDSNLAQIEATLQYLPKLNIEQFISNGKSVFAGWIYTNPGETSVFSLKYNLSEGLNLEKKLIPFRLIFERQSGVKTSFSYQITAPDGYYWQESGAEVFEYLDNNPAGRTILDLSLKKT